MRKFQEAKLYAMFCVALVYGVAGVVLIVVTVQDNCQSCPSSTPEFCAELYCHACLVNTSQFCQHKQAHPSPDNESLLFWARNGCFLLLLFFWMILWSIRETGTPASSITPAQLRALNWALHGTTPKRSRTLDTCSHLLYLDS